MNDKETSTNTKPRDRSTPYPAINLEEAVERIKLLHDSMGSGPYKRSAVAVGIGYKSLSGISARKVAALTHYGLLNRDGENHSISRLSERIIFETSASDKLEAIETAAKNPLLFSRLYEKYQGEKLPSLLHNILITEFNVGSAVSQEVSTLFQETMKFAGLLGENGVLGLMTNKTTERQEVVEAQATERSSAENVMHSEIQSTKNKYRRVLEGESWTAIITSDFKLTSEIKTALRALEDAMDEAESNYNDQEE